MRLIRLPSIFRPMDALSSRRGAMQLTVCRSCTTSRLASLPPQSIGGCFVITFRKYRNFGHAGPPKTRLYDKCFFFLISSLLCGAFVDWTRIRLAVIEQFEWFKKRFPPRVDALVASTVNEQHQVAEHGALEKREEADQEMDATIADQKKDAVTPTQEEDDDEKKKVGFRNRKIIEYENRIRTYSTPDKIFRYFATLQHAHTSEVFMTPADFLRSITPGIQQPEGLGLDQFRRFDPAREIVSLDLPPESIFFKLGESGLISFSNYIFLLTVLSTSRRHFEIAFQMFDLNGDGDVDAEEFLEVESLMLHSSSIGARHRDHGVTGSTFRGTSSALATYFFGRDRKGKLTIKQFLDFQEQLQTEILRLEFYRKDPDENGAISPKQFADLLVAYSGFARKKREKILKRVGKHFIGKEVRLKFDDYLKFFEFINCIEDIDTALTFYHIAGASIDQQTLKHVSRTVANLDLPEEVMEVLFVLFDENGDGQLSNREFVSVMKNRVQRGLEKPKDTGFIKLLNAVLECSNRMKPNILHK